MIHLPGGIIAHAASNRNLLGEQQVCMSPGGSCRLALSLLSPAGLPGTQIDEGPQHPIPLSGGIAGGTGLAKS